MPKGGPGGSRSPERLLPSLCDPIVATGRQRPWWLRDRFLREYGKVSFWHKLDPLLGGTFRAARMSGEGNPPQAGA
jgi:hypothetical protein